MSGRRTVLRPLPGDEVLPGRELVPLAEPVPAKGALHLWEWKPPDGPLAGGEVARR